LKIHLHRNSLFTPLLGGADRYYASGLCPKGHWAARKGCRRRKTFFVKNYKFKNNFMKKQFTIFLLLILSSSLLFIAKNVFATEGACSYHSGANCGIGHINNRAVCNDGWLSSVPYDDMEECIGYSYSCTLYLSNQQYISQKTVLKQDLEIQKIEIDKLKSDLSNLDYKEAQALIDLQESTIGRGITAGGLQPQINAINREYAQKRLNLSQQIDTTVSLYNDSVKKYNGICRIYTDEEKNNICVQNFGNQQKFNNGFCVALPPIVTACSLWTYSNWTNCVNGKQTRSVISSYPNNCIGGNPILGQSCQYEIKTEEKNNNATTNNQTKENSNSNLNGKNFIEQEKTLITKIDKNLSKRVIGNILLQVEKNGEGWYVYPDDQKKYYLGRPADAFSIMRNLGLGIKHSELNNYLNAKFPSRLSGKIMLDVEQNGEAYYINPDDLKAYYLSRPSDAFRIMRELGLGITNDDVRKIDVGEILNSL